MLETIASHLAAVAQFLGGGLLALLVNLSLQKTKSKILTRRAAQRTAAKEFETALSSDRLEVLGSYLRKHLGGIELSAYINDTGVSGRVNRYLERLSSYLEVPEPPRVQERSPRPNDVDGAVRSDVAVVNEAAERVQGGETWTGLAALRRDLERRLLVASPTDKGRRSPPYLRIEDKGVREQIREFWYWASRAIHGDEIPAEQARRAILLASKIYSRLAAMNEPGFTDIPLPSGDGTKEKS